MVIKVYVSGISGNKEVKKRQQRVTMILDSKNIQYTVIDIAEPGNEGDKEFMQENSKARDSKHPLPPQIFNGEHYCGDYEDFDMANELDTLEKFLKTSINEDNSNNLENGISNGSKQEIIKEDSLKEGYEESSEETVSNVNHNDVEAVSLGNDAQSELEEIPHNSGDTSKDLDEITSDLDNNTNPLDTHANVGDESESLKNDENEHEAAEVDKLSSNDSTDEE
ncbi:hypothetical protein V9T40_004464 [Parthenolecanium corni]|uniref:SH3 domain-binding glutamic acid-rich protein n=1 Tax=Parthenolecanium corni TaxID=536013 RepID=A0AAN9Y9L1_9HEMI